MKNSLNPIAIGLVVLAAIVAINTIIGTAMFYSSDEQDVMFLYMQYSLMMNPFGYWLIALSLLSFGALAQVASDYHHYLYESKVPWISSGLLYSLAVLLFLAATGDVIFQLFVEMTARGQLALASARNSEFGVQGALDRSLLMRTFPYNLLQYAVPVGHALTGILLIGAAQRIALLKSEVDDVAQAPEASFNA
jgi:hypothetical protein